AKLQKAREILGYLAKACRFNHAVAIHHLIRVEGKSKSKPAVVCSAISPTCLIPTSILVSQVRRELGEIQALLWIELPIFNRYCRKTRACSHTGRHVRFGRYVRHIDVLDDDLNARLLRKLARIGQPLIFVALDKSLPSQELQVCALLRCHVVLRRRSYCRSRHCSGYCGSTQRFDRISPRKRAHLRLLSCRVSDQHYGF